MTASGKVLRGVALRGGTYTDVNDIIPLTTAPATETSRPHQSFNSEVFYPNQVWVPNFYDAVDGGATRLVTVPAQYKSSSPGSTSGTVRTFTNLDLALYYMPSNWTQRQRHHAQAAAVSAGPSIDGTRATVTGSNVTFEVNASNDGSAGVQAVWVLYTATSGPMYGRWQPLDLTQSGTDPTLWSGTLDLGSTPAEQRAVHGAGGQRRRPDLVGHEPRRLLLGGRRVDHAAAPAGSDVRSRCPARRRAPSRSSRRSAPSSPPATAAASRARPWCSTSVASRRWR